LWLAMWRVKNIFEPNVLKWVIYKKFISCSPFAFLSSMLRSFTNFKRNGAHLEGKKKFEKNKNCPLSRLECFEHEKTF
jgi:hypothetical protein